MAQAGPLQQDRPTGHGSDGSAGTTMWAVVLEATIVVGLALVASVVTTWPLVLHLGTVAHDATDAPFQAWTIDHVQWAITTGGPLWDANIFAPNRRTLAYSDSLLGLAIPLLPLRWFGVGPIAQLNTALLVGMSASAGAGYLFGRVVTRCRSGAAITAVASAYGPFGATSTSHLHTAVRPGIALAATATWWLTDRSHQGRGLRAPTVLLVASVVWQMSVSFYPGVYSVAAVLVVLAVRWRSLERRAVGAAALALLVCGAATLSLAIPYLQVLDEGRQFVRSPDEIANLGMDITTVKPGLTVWGDLLAPDSFSLPAFPGLALLVLGTVGLIGGIRRPGRTRVMSTTGLAFVLTGAFLALGTAGSGWRAASPYRLLFDHVPGFTILRATGRAWILGVLGLGLLGAVGCRVLGSIAAGGDGGARRSSRATALVATLGVVATVFEGYGSWSDRPTIEVSAVDHALAVEPVAGGVVYLPALVPGGSAELATTFGQVENVFGTTAHHRRTPNGYSGLGPAEWPAFSARMRGLPSPTTLGELRRIDVTFVVVRSTVRGTPWERLINPARAAPLRLVGRYGGDILYRLPPP